MRQEKQILLDEIKGHMESYPSFVVMRHVGLTANTVSDFRRDVAKKGGNVEFVRKRVLVKAAEAAGIPLTLEMLPGHIGLVFVPQDPIELTKFVFQFSKDNEAGVEILGGRFEGKLYGASQVEMLSSLPSKDEMRAQFLGTLEAPLSHTLSVLDAILSSVVYCLDNKCKQEEGKG